MFDYFRRRRLTAAARRLMAARQVAGAGVYLSDWPRSPLAVQPGVTATGIIEWCRQTMASTRAPWGIAQFDFALVAVSEGAHLSLRRLTPADLYPGDSLMVTIERFLAEHRPASVSAGLYSWGDAAHALSGH